MDEFGGDDADFAALAASVEKAAPPRPAAASSSSPATQQKVVQPTPQALPTRSGPSAILVSPRQKGNPSLNYIRSLPWEYSDTPADYILGATTCALFLSLKYHRLHPEYIYSRIRALGQKYNLRILLALVDIQNHEESLRELSKTSLINNLTLILCWSPQEAARYLELYKSFEHASATSIRAHQSTTYAEKMTDFITVPRSINKTDAISLVSAFGSVRAAVNARPEQIADITGWGEKKVQRWCSTVRENFRMKKAAARRHPGLAREGSSMSSVAPSGGNTPALAREESSMISTRQESIEDDCIARPSSTARVASTASGPPKRLASQTINDDDDGKIDEDALIAAAELDAADRQAISTTAAKVSTAAAAQGDASSASSNSRAGGGKREELGDGIAAALAKLRQGN